MKPARFMPKIYLPERLTFALYWKVWVFPSKRAMHAYAAWRTDGRNVDGFAGIVIPMHTERIIGRRPELRPKLGELLLCRQALGTSVLSHEALHMATSTLRSVGPTELLRLGPEIDEPEERLAYLMCGLCRQVVDGLYERDILPA